MGVYTTTPKTWAVGNKITAALLNSDVRDDVNAFDADDSYTPSWTAATTNPVIGNGTIVGAFTQVQKRVFWRVLITMGSTTTYGTGNWQISLPVAASAATALINFPIGNWSGNPAGARSNGQVLHDSVASRAFFVVGGAATLVTNTAPGTWANGNVFYMSGQYEAA